MPESLRVVTAPSELPVTLALAKSHLRVDHTADDDLITALLQAAAADCSVESGQGVGVGTYAVTLDEFPSALGLVGVFGGSGDCPGDYRDALYRSEIRLPVRPVASITSVAYYDADGESQTLASDGYYLGGQTGRLAPAAGGWPGTHYGRPEAVAITFTAGTAAASLPHQVVAAVLLIVADRYQHRGDTDQDRPIPAAARRLLAQVSQGVYA